MRVLLIEDDSTAATGITMTLRAESYVVDTTDLGEDGLEIAKLYDYDIILLDLMLPDIDGYEVLRRLRASRVRTPVLVLSGLGVNEPNSRTRGLNLGADDFLTKPFHPRELIARMQTIIRRTRGHSESTIRTGRMTVNLDRRVVEIDGRLLPLPDKEYRVLELLCLRKGKTLTKEMFLSHLYGGRDEPDSKIIDVYVCKLRKKLKDATGDSHIIETIWGRGYLLREPASVVA